MRREWKKTMLLAAVLTGLLTGCGAKKNTSEELDPEDPVTVTIWHYYNGVQQVSFDEMVKEFNETVGVEQGIIVESFTKSSIDELSESLLASVKKESGAEDTPDIFAVYPETAFVLDQMGALADLRQYLTEEELAEYVPAYVQEGDMGDGSLKIFPTAKSTEIMMLNKTAWDEFAAAEDVTAEDIGTLEGLALTAEKYYEYTDALTPQVPNDGKPLFGRDSVANYMYIGAKQLGMDYITIGEDQKLSVTVEKDVLKALWENYYVPFVKGYYAAKGRYRSDDVKTGTVIALVGSTTGAAYFPKNVTVNDDETYPIDCLVLPVPGFADGEPYLVQQGAGMSVLKSDARSERASMEFLKWFTQEERNIRFSVASGYLPVKTAANDVEKIRAVDGASETPMNAEMESTIETAISQIGEKNLYTSRPFAESAACREYIGAAMSEAAAADYEAAAARIAAGENREKVLQEYVSDEAFETWYESFVSGLEALIEE